jgi:hypothetical protein
VSRRSLVAAAVVSLSVLTACGASAPPGKELAVELIDTMEFGLDPESDADEIESIRTCMRAEVENFAIDPQDGFSSFDDVAERAADEQPRAVEIMGEFADALAGCVP